MAGCDSLGLTGHTEREAHRQAQQERQAFDQQKREYIDTCRDALGSLLNHSESLAEGLDDIEDSVEDCQRGRPDCIDSMVNRIDYIKGNSGISMDRTDAYLSTYDGADRVKTDFNDLSSRVELDINDALRDNYESAKQIGGLAKQVHRLKVGDEVILEKCYQDLEVVGVQNKVVGKVLSHSKRTEAREEEAQQSSLMPETPGDVAYSQASIGPAGLAVGIACVAVYCVGKVRKALTRNYGAGDS
ncbi:hypothetical protein KY362_03240 [Candidatus Woesearchaeota archaeon]|nr:hypothetical protein [Candidatus Woesearchaeota archaeon]